MDQNLTTSGAIAQAIRGHNRLVQAVLLYFEWQVQYFGGFCLDTNDLYLFLRSNGVMKGNQRLNDLLLKKLLVHEGKFILSFDNGDGQHNYSRMEDVLPQERIPLCSLFIELGFRYDVLSNSADLLSRQSRNPQLKPCWISKTSSSSKVMLTNQDVRVPARKKEIQYDENGKLISDSSLALNSAKQLRSDNSAKNRKSRKKKSRSKSSKQNAANGSKTKQNTNTDKAVDLNQILERIVRAELAGKVPQYILDRYDQRLKDKETEKQRQKTKLARKDGDAWHSVILNGTGGKFKKK